MPLAPRLSDAAASIAADAVTKLLDSGYIRIYNGEQPDSPEVAVKEQKLLAELRFAESAFTPAYAGVAVANAIKPDEAAKASGRPTWYRLYSADGTAVADGSAGKKEANLIIPADQIVSGARLVIDDYRWTQKRD